MAPPGTAERDGKRGLQEDTTTAAHPSRPPSPPAAMPAAAVTGGAAAELPSVCAVDTLAV